MRNLSHTLSQLRLSFPSSIPLLLSAPLPKNIPHPASSDPSPPSSFPITHYPLYLLDLWARLLRLSGPHRTVEVEACSSFSTSSLLHYSDYHKKSYITLAPHETTSSSVSSPLSPEIKSSTPPIPVCHCIQPWKGRALLPSSVDLQRLQPWTEWVTRRYCIHSGNLTCSSPFLLKRHNNNLTRSTFPSNIASV